MMAGVLGEPRFLIKIVPVHSYLPTVGSIRYLSMLPVSPTFSEASLILFLVSYKKNPE